MHGYQYVGEGAGGELTGLAHVRHVKDALLYRGGGGERRGEQDVRRVDGGKTGPEETAGKACGIGHPYNSQRRCYTSCSMHG